MARRTTPTAAYTILGLPYSRTEDVSAEDVKRAYRRALLRWHPDKTAAASSAGEVASTTTLSGRGVDNAEAARAQDGKGKETPYSIDDISAAYRTLLDPGLRKELDRYLATHNTTAGVELGRDQAWLSGLDIVDLDDLTYDEAGGEWYKPCRCGSGRGFVVREAELEEAADEAERGGRGGKGGGEVLVGCGGCSLWIRVGFGVVDEKS